MQTRAERTRTARRKTSSERVSSSSKKKEEQHHRSSWWRPSARQVRLWARVLVCLSVGLVVLSSVLAGSNLTAGGSDVLVPEKVLLVTAHPDDEAMFFAPTILALVGMGVQLHALCLSTGNADKLGHIREQELVESYARLGVPADRVQSVDDDRLIDGMETEWDVDAIAEHVVARVQASGPFQAIITFDERGVSSHPNHRSCFRTIQHIAHSSLLSPSASFYTLHTIPVPLKFLSLPLALARQILPADPKHRLRFLSSIKGYLHALKAMAAHDSQLVWFRYLYVMTSVYMYNNELVKL